MAKHKKQKQPTPKTSFQHKQLATKSNAPTDHQQCYRSGNAPAHEKWQCPAKDVTCNTCGERGHYNKVCNTPLFLGSVDVGTYPWYTDLTIRSHKVRFKIDTGADVSAIPAQTYYTITDRVSHLTETDRPLFGPGGTPLSVIGKYTESKGKGKEVIQEDVYVIKDLNKGLLSRPASVKFNLPFGKASAPEHFQWRMSMIS